MKNHLSWWSARLVLKSSLVVLIGATTIDIGASMRHVLVVDPTPTVAMPGEVQVSGTTTLGI